VDGEWYSESPPVAGSASGLYAVERVEVAICRTVDGLCWDGTGWVSGAVWLTAAGTTNWTYALPPLEWGGYALYARAWDDHGQVDATPAVVSFHLGNVLFLPLVARD
jgi:hypothetical protein